MAKKQYCFNCGEYLGDTENYSGDVASCGEQECEHELRNMQREEDAEAQEAAQRDNYGRYRFDRYR